MPLRRPPLLLLAAALPGVSAAQQAQIRLAHFPSVTVADGRSTVTVTAEVRDINGRVVPDGTRIIFASDLGSFREPVVPTSGGVARAVFVAGNVPGFVKITASAMGGEAAPSTIDFELVADKASLSSAREYVELASATGVQYTADARIVAAAGPARGATLRYKEVFLEADDLQYDIKLNAVRARRASLKIGRAEARLYDELWIQLNNRRGYGLTTYRAARTTPVFAGAGFAAVGVDPDGNPVAPVEAELYGSVEILGSAIRPSSFPVGSTMFQWVDLSDAPSSVIAKRATVYPRKGIQFARAEVLVGNARVIKVPLFELSFNGGNVTPLVTEQFLNIRDNQLAVNFPYYLNLEPGQTSNFRLRTGDNFGRGVGAQRGLFLDFEHSWNRGDDMEGGLTFRGVGRADWTLGMRQYIRFDERSSAYASLDMPAARSILGAIGASRQMAGFQLSLSANASQTFRGLRSTSQDWNFVAERDPIGLGKVPAKLFIGLTALQSRSSLGDAGGGQGGYGGFARIQTSAIPLDKRSLLTSSFTARALAGGSGTDQGGLALLASTSVSRSFGSAASAVVSYDFTKDGYTDRFQGSHRLGLTGNASVGRFTFSGSGSKALDVARDSVFLDLGYRMNGTWRLGYQYTSDRFVGASFLEYNFVLGYRFGWKEIGLTWSNRTKRFGFQILNVAF